jgi:hypothetical protein
LLILNLSNYLAVSFELSEISFFQDKFLKNLRFLCLKAHCSKLIAK